VWTYLLSSRLREIDPHGWECLPKSRRNRARRLKSPEAKTLTVKKRFMAAYEPRRAEKPERWPRKGLAAHAAFGRKKAVDK